MLKNSRWVGDEFADTARAMHAGEIEPEQVHGNATLAQAKALVDDGVPVAPLPLPVIPPTRSIDRARRRTPILRCGDPVAQQDRASNS